MPAPLCGRGSMARSARLSALDQQPSTFAIHDDRMIARDQDLPKAQVRARGTLSDHNAAVLPFNGKVVLYCLQQFGIG